MRDVILCPVLANMLSSRPGAPPYKRYRQSILYIILYPKSSSYLLVISQHYLNLNRMHHNNFVQRQSPGAFRLF
uniref:Uncharacterized protein n=1 Tax=Pararge aegeria TaxID=116150 RepID=S4PSV8_9NEOP